MQVNMREAMRMRQRVDYVEIESDYLWDYPQSEVLEALAESYFYMMAHEFPGFRILDRHVAYEVYQDPIWNALKVAIWWKPPAGECYFPELGYGRTFDWGQNGPRLRISVPRPAELEAHVQFDPDKIVPESPTDHYEPVGWSDTLHAWVYKKEK